MSEIRVKTDPVNPDQNRIAQPGKNLLAQESSLKGTLVSVMILGGFIAVTWLGVFMLFLARN
jgi:hypothetical protein